jgi:hypothetical protein
MFVFGVIRLNRKTERGQLIMEMKGNKPSKHSQRKVFLRKRFDIVKEWLFHRE